MTLICHCEEAQPTRQSSRINSTMHLAINAFLNPLDRHAALAMTGHPRHTWTPTFAKLSIDDFEQVKDCSHTFGL